MRYKKTYLILAALLVVIIWIQIVNPSFVNRIRPAITDLAEFPLKIATKVVKGVYNLAASKNRYEKKIAALEKDIALLKKETVATKEILEENQRLRALLLFRAKLPSNAIAAEVIGRDPSSWDSFIIIDKGNSDGVKPNMAIAKSEGLVGEVFEAGENTAKVMLIDNPNSKVGAVIQRTREQGMLIGLGGGLCKIIYLSYDTDAKPGDIVVTGESSSKYLKGILIGEVTAVLKNSNSLYASAIVKPSCNLFKVEEVLCME